MPDKIESLVVSCEGGLDTTENYLKLAQSYPGRATKLINFEPSLYGGYRRINGYQYYDEGYPEVGVELAEGKVLLVAMFDDDFSGSNILITARKDIGADTYSFYRYTFGVGWEKYTTPVRATQISSREVLRIRHASFNFGDGNKIIFVDGVNPAIVFDGFEWFELKSTETGADADNAGGNQVVDAPAIVEIFKNHVFLSGDEDFRSIVCHSAPNAWFDWTSANGGGQMFAGFNVVQLKPFRDYLYLFGSQAINRIETENTDFVVKPVTANVGCIARDSVVEIGGDLAFLSPDGVRPVAGTSNIGDVELETVSKSIQVLFSGLGAEYDLSKLVSVVIRGKSQIRYFVSDEEASAVSSYGIIGAIRISDSSPKWEFSELTGISVSACDSAFINGAEVVVHGDYNGRIYRQEVGYSFNGAPITAIYQTPYFDMEEPTVRKTMRKVYTFLRPEGNATLGLAVRYNWGDNSSPTPANYSIEAEMTIPKYGDGSTYGSINYGSNEKPVIMTDIQGSGLSTRFSYSTTGTEPCYSIQGFAIDYTVEDRR